MPFNQAGETVVERFPIAVPFSNRQSSTVGTDPYLQDCFIERSQGKMFVVKRPGLASAFTYNGGGAANGQGLVYYKGLLFAMGSNTGYLLSSTVPTSSTQATWGQTNITGTAPWKIRADFACVVFNNRVYVSGGQDNAGTYLNDVWSTDDFVTWKQENSAAQWAGRFAHKMVVLGDTMYLCGGYNGAYLNDVWATTDGVTWTQATANAGWTARAYFNVVTFNNGIWVLGGYDGTNYLNDCWYSPDGVTWSQLSTAAGWSGRRSFGATVFLNKIWVVGGLRAAGTSNESWYSSDGTVWTLAQAASFATARQGFPLVVYADKMWAIGGLDSGAAIVDDVYSSPDGVTWTLVTTAPGFGVRDFASAVAFPTPTAYSTIRAWSIFIIGGFSGSYLNTVYFGLLDTNNPTSFATGSAGSTSEQWQSATTSSGNYLCWKNTYGMFVLWAGTFRPVTDTNYPARTVPGVVCLNGRIYVMDVNGNIYGSFIENPFRYSSLNVINAEYQSDPGVALAKIQNLIVALGTETIQFFYDSGQGAAGTGEGTVLRPQQNATLQIGCAHADSVSMMDTALIFMGRSAQAGRGVYLMNGTQPVKVSTPDIDRLLNSATLASGVNSFTVEVGGHNFYYLSLTSLGITLGWDSVDKEWHILTDGGLSNFRAINYATDGISNWVQNRSLGIVYTYSPTVYGDAGSNIICIALGDKIDFRGNERKFCSSTEIIADRRAVDATNNLLVRWSDDDNVTFNTGYTVDLVKARPRIVRCGSFRRRSHLLTHTSSTNPLRLEAVELTIEPGDV